MFAVVITEKGGAQRRLEFDKNEVTIGRVQGNDIILPKGNVSKRHSRIVLKDNRFIVVDLKSTNGTYVNGRKITSPLVVKAGDKIYIGDFILTLEEGAGAAAGAPAPQPEQPSAPAPAPSPAAAPPGPAPGPPQPPSRPSAPPPLPGRAGPPAPAPAPAPVPQAPSPMQASPAPVPAGPPPGPAPAPVMSPAPVPSQPSPAPAPAPAPAPTASAPEPADRFPLDEEPAGNDEGSAPSPRVVSSQPEPTPTPGGGGGADSVRPPAPTPGPAARPSLGQAAQSNGGVSGDDFWRALVVAAVGAGKDADTAMKLADAIVERSAQRD